MGVGGKGLTSMLTDTKINVCIVAKLKTSTEVKNFHEHGDILRRPEMPNLIM